MSGVTGAVIAGSVITAGASVYGSRQASNASQRGANAATSESARQFDLIRDDTAGLRNIQAGALDRLSQLYGFAPPSQASQPLSYEDWLAGNPPAQAQAGPPAVSGQLSGRTAGIRGIGGRLPGPNQGGIQVRNPTGGPADAQSRQAYQQYVDNFQPVAPPSASNSPDLSAFTQSPDYQFNLQQGQQAIDRSLAARGRALSGAGVREGVRFASGMASNEYGNFVNRLLATAGLGTTGVTTSANAGMASAGQIGAAQQNAGNTRASAYMTGAQGVNNAFQGGISNYLTHQFLNNALSK